VVQLKVVSLHREYLMKVIPCIIRYIYQIVCVHTELCYDMSLCLSVEVKTLNTGTVLVHRQ